MKAEVSLARNWRTNDSARSKSRASIAARMSFALACKFCASAVIENAAIRRSNTARNKFILCHPDSSKEVRFKRLGVKHRAQHQFVNDDKLIRHMCKLIIAWIMDHRCYAGEEEVLRNGVAAEGLVVHR